MGLFTLDFVCMPFSSVRLLWTTLELPDYYAASLWLYLLEWMIIVRYTQVRPFNADHA